MNTKSVAILVPAKNEGKVLSKTLTSLLSLVSASDLYVVDDGSTDNTYEIARHYTNNVLSTQATGKASALNLGIKHFNLTKRYQFIFFMDADTRPRANFLEKIKEHFSKDINGEVVCIVGRVNGSKMNWLSRYRQWEYQLSHLIHKTAQEHIGSIIVVPGCATVYRSYIFDKLNFSQDTLTEDMDFTFLLHRNGYSKMIFENKAVVDTIDPQNLVDFVKQLNRWYTGFWQVVKKHNIPWEGQMLDLEVCMLALEGLYNGLLVIFFSLFAIELLLIGHLGIFMFPLAIDFFLFFLPSLVWSSMVDHDYKRLLLVPHFYFLRFLSSLLFIKCYFSSFLSSNNSQGWDSKRYAG